MGTRSPAMEERTLIERLARHLATGNPEQWPERVADAASILAILKDPDAEMRKAGDESQWRAMIDAALRERWTVATTPGGDQAEPGTDEEGEISLPRHGVTDNRADWVHVHNSQEKSS
ncbi:hypothetical protein K663_10210 [Sphingobium sp. MI1205]|nr:hypothetical protein K663_10210 [Sphingobium sp. MI1205]